MNKKVTPEYLDSLVVHDIENGLFRHNRESFTNEELFELEMKYIFENNWVYLAHESQIPFNCSRYIFCSISLHKKYSN